MKKPLAGVVISILLVVIVALVVFPQIKPFGITSSQSSQTSLIQERVVEISELATLEYEYTKARIYRDDTKILWTDIRIAETIKIVEAHPDPYARAYS